jgi:ketosteroid isomerase-like protein
MLGMRGTIKESFLGVQATGKAISIRGVHVCELKGDRVSRVSDYWDTSTLMGQLGLLPSSPQN